MKKTVLILLLLAAPQIYAQKNVAFDSMRVQKYFVMINTAGDTVAEFGANAKLTPHEINFPAIAFFPPADSGATLDTLDNKSEFYSFSGLSALGSVVLEFGIPSWAIRIDSIKILISTASTTGDSIGYILRSRTYGLNDNVETDAWVTTNSGQIDMGTVGDELKFLTIALALTITDLNGWTRWDFKRDNTISNNSLSLSRFHGATFYFTSKR